MEGVWVKSCNFGSQVNSDSHIFSNSENPDETAPYELRHVISENVAF